MVIRASNRFSKTATTPLQRLRTHVHCRVGDFSYLNTAIPLDTSDQTGGALASFLPRQPSGYRLDTPRYIAGQ